MVTAVVNATPNPEFEEHTYIQWFKAAPSQAVNGQFIELSLNGVGQAIFRAVSWRVVEKALRGAGWYAQTIQDRFAFIPNWLSLLILYLRFDVDADIVRDYSGNGRNHTWANGSSGSRTHDATLEPYGGESAVGSSGSGWADASWNGMSYVGDAAGYNSEPLTFEYVNAFPDISGTPILMQGGDGTYYWKLFINPDGSVEFRIKTAALSYSFKTAAAVIAASASVEYTIQFVLTNGGQNGQFYIAKRTDEFAVTLTTRSAF